MVPVNWNGGIWNLIFGIYEHYYTSRGDQETLHHGEATAAGAERYFTGYN